MNFVCNICKTHLFMNLFNFIVFMFNFANVKQNKAIGCS